MAADQRDDLFPQLRNPESIGVINERCLIRTQGDYRVVIVAGIILAHYAVEDRMSEAHAMVSLVEQGLADQKEVARAFGRCKRTVRRHQRRYEQGGLPALGHGRGYPEGRGRLKKTRAQLIYRLKASGHSNREIALGPVYPGRPEPLPFSAVTPAGAHDHLRGADSRPPTSLRKPAKPLCGGNSTPILPCLTSLSQTHFNHIEKANSYELSPSTDYI